MELEKQIQQLAAKLNKIEQNTSAKYFQAMEEKLSAYLLDELDKKMNATQEQAMDELLELRLSVLFNKKVQTLENKLQQLQTELAKVKKARAGGELDKAENMQTADIKAQQQFMLSEKVSRHLEQLIEENAQFAEKIQQIRQFSVWIASAAGASLLISLMLYVFS